jgi:hypothetical protein
MRRNGFGGLLSVAVLLGAATSGCAGASGPVAASSSASPSGPPAGNGCPRPTDQGGPLYYAVTGAFVRIQASPGGDRQVVLQPSPASPERYYRATDEVLSRLSGARRGAPVTMLSYRTSSMAGGGGGDPPFSCVEL